eukprot:Skav224455  [mRNA]  locus=scaffold4460:8908:21109:+ [translate_table: standard]
MQKLLAILVVFQTVADRVPELDVEVSSVLQSFSSKTGQHDQHSAAAGEANGVGLDQFRLRLLSEYEASLVSVFGLFCLRGSQESLNSRYSRNDHRTMLLGDVSKQTDMAIVTHICDAQWAPGAMALAASLKKAGTKYNLVILLTSDFDKRYHRLFGHLFDKVYVEEPLYEHPSIIRAGADCVTLQLRSWQLPYRKILIALKSHDSMLEESTELTARIDKDLEYQFNSGLLVMEPAESTFQKLRSSHFLNHFFPSCEQPQEQDVGCWKGKLSEPGLQLAAVMKAKPKSLALAKFQQAGQLTIAKNKAVKSETKKDKGIDVIQVGSIAAAAFLVLWIIASTVVSAVFTVRYMGIVEEDQAWYLLQGSARSAATEAKAVMETVMQAKSDLISAIDHGLIKTSYDYAAIESTLVPTMALTLGDQTYSLCRENVSTTQTSNYCLYLFVYMLYIYIVRT